LALQNRKLTAIVEIAATADIAVMGKAHPDMHDG
jgi:hypothetical protein